MVLSRNVKLPGPFFFSKLLKILYTFWDWKILQSFFKVSCIWSVFFNLLPNHLNLINMWEKTWWLVKVTLRSLTGYFSFQPGAYFDHRPFGSVVYIYYEKIYSLKVLLKCTSAQKCLGTGRGAGLKTDYTSSQLCLP